MNRSMVLFAVAVCLLASIGTQAYGYGRIAIFADENRSVSEVWYSQEMTQFNIYIFCLPGDDGMMCAEYSVKYPENVLASSFTGNPALSIALGNLDDGMSACFAECQNDWVWTHTQTLFLTDATPATIEIEAHPDAGVYQFANCDPGFPTETIFYSNPLFLNSIFTYDNEPPAVQSAESTDQNHVVIRFDEPLFAETALVQENFTIFEKGTPGNLVDLIPSSLTEEDRTITLILPDMLIHGATYTLRVGGVMDCRGNVMPDTFVDFLGHDIYPPEYTVSEVDPDRLWIMVSFNEPVQPFGATYIHSYFFYEDPYAYVDFDVIEANLQPNGKDVQVIFDSKIKAGMTYRLWVRHVQDLAGNRVDYDDRVFFGIPDTYPPEIIDISGVTSDILSVRFDEEVDLSSALEPTNYEVLEGGDPALIVGVTRVTTDVNPDWLYLFLDRSIDIDGTHVLRYTRICDLIGNCIGSGGEPALTVSFVIDPSIATMLESFSADFLNACIDIRWRLSEPVPGDRLIIMRSKEDDADFTAIEHPDIDIEGLEYRFVDERVEAGADYRYRVVYMSDEGEKLLFETETISTSPAAYSLLQNRPNPFNPTTEITYSLPEAGHVTIEIFEVSGRRVKRIVDEHRQVGIHRTIWNGLDQGGAVVASGIYFYRIKAGKWSRTRKMVLFR